MNINMNSMMQMMIASSLMSGKGFDFGNFMGDLTFDKLLGLQMLSNVDFGGTLNLNGNDNKGLSKDDLLDIIKAVQEAKASNNN